MRLNARTAIVTGASTGIGRATALALAREGADVVVHYLQSEEAARNVVNEIRQTGRRTIAVQADVSKASDVQRAFAEISTVFDQIDILVNNAGSHVKRATIVDMSEELWDATVDVNLKSAYLWAKAVLPLMQQQRAGSIVNVSSVSARTGGGYGAVAYAAAKGGLISFTHGLAKELAPYGIRVNAVVPGIIDTPLHDKFTPREVKEATLRMVPLSRYGAPEEVAATIIFLLSEEGSYITGQSLDVNGGWVMH